MADIETKDFDTLIGEQAVIIQGNSGRSLIDFTIGSILRAIVEAYSAVAMWLQGLILQVLALTRAATSVGTDLDSWMADFGFDRLDADAAVGLLTFSRQSTTIQAVVPIGAQAQTTDGSVTFAVTLDTTNGAYSADLGGYVVPIGTSSVVVPAAAVTAGAVGNVQAHTVNLLGQAIVGIDSVDNASATTGGSDAESDGAMRVRFVAYLASLSKAIKTAVEYAVSTVDQSLAQSVVENETRDGTARPGFFYVVVDDGTGSPTDETLSAVYAAIDAVRPLCSTFAVYGPYVETANVSMTLTTSANHGAAVTAAEAALDAMLNSLPIGGGLNWAQLISTAIDASPYITDVSDVLLNGGTANLPPVDGQVIRPGTIAVS